MVAYVDIRQRSQFSALVDSWCCSSRFVFPPNFVSIPIFNWTGLGRTNSFCLCRDTDGDGDGDEGSIGDHISDVADDLSAHNIEDSLSPANNAGRGTDFDLVDKIVICFKQAFGQKLNSKWELTFGGNCRFKIYLNNVIDGVSQDWR